MLKICHLSSFSERVNISKETTKSSHCCLLDKFLYQSMKLEGEACARACDGNALVVCFSNVSITN